MPISFLCSAGCLTNISDSLRYFLKLERRLAPHVITGASISNGLLLSALITALRYGRAKGKRSVWKHSIGRKLKSTAIKERFVVCPDPRSPIPLDLAKSFRAMFDHELFCFTSKKMNTMQSGKKRRRSSAGAQSDQCGNPAFRDAGSSCDLRHTLFPVLTRQ